MTKIIWVDLDEVLAELVDYCLYYHDYKINWKEITREKIEDYYIHHMVEYDISLEQAIDWFRKPLFDDFNLEVKKVIWAIDVLKKLKNKSYILKIITARPWDLFWEYTKKWVEKHYPNIFNEIIFANHFTWKDKTKSEICKDHWIKNMIEDNPDYALELAKNWIKTYLLEKPWNKNFRKHKNIILVKSWENIDL